LLPPEFIKAWNIRDYYSTGQLKSKKNQVFRIRIVEESGQENLLVLKKFRKSSNFQKEVVLFSALVEERAPIPEVYYSKNDIIIMEYIEGRLLLETLCSKESGTFQQLGDALEKLYRGLAKAFKSGKLKGISGSQAFSDLNDTLANKNDALFHRLECENSASDMTSLILGDMNLRNFIWQQDKNKIVRVDLESVKPGRIAEDLGQMLAFLISYDPPFSERKLKTGSSLCDYLANRLTVAREEIEKELRAELQIIGSRRGMEIPDFVI